MPAKRTTEQITAATLMAAFVTREMPLFCENIGVIEAVGREVGCVAVFEG